MTISLFFSTLISLQDKWNHMLAVVLGGKKQQEKKKRGKFEDDVQLEEEQSRADKAAKNWFGKNKSHRVIYRLCCFSPTSVLI